VINDEIFDTFFSPPLLADSFTEISETDVDHFNLFLYSHIKPLPNLVLTVGASGDFFDSGSKDGGTQEQEKDQFNPKFGITWNPFPATTLRGAVFRTLTRTLITEQTLEPTQVAGFNQFFDDADATEAWRYGAAVDQKFSGNVYGGVEFSKRDLEVPFIGLPPPPAPPVPLQQEADWEEYLARAYLYWTPHEWLALRAEYQYEKFERAPEFTYGIKDVKTHRFPLGINFFHPSGLSAGLQATYHDQEGDFERLDAPLGTFEPGKDDFWVVDAAVSYRLPKRRGVITAGVTNLFDEEFEFADTDINNPGVQPESVFFVKATFALP
jgi:outer membrane receptor protein involved in Fe transport